MMPAERSAAIDAGHADGHQGKHSSNQEPPLNPVAMTEDDVSRLQERDRNGEANHLFEAEEVRTKRDADERAPKPRRCLHRVGTEYNDREG